MFRLWQSLPAFLMLIMFALPVKAQGFGDEFNTDIAVTVLAKDAKFVGDAVGGAQITIRNKLTGEIMVDGHTYGTTGNTETIMADPQERFATLSDQDSARFEFSLAILEPTPVTITAIAPIAQMQGAVEVSTDYVLIPGKDYTDGDGIMLEMPGMVVDVLNPVPHEKLDFNPDIPLTITANVMKVCGCKIENDSPWEPENYEIEAHVYRGTQFISALPMQYAGKAGLYETRVKIPLSGSYKIVVTAFDKNTKEGGMDATTVVLAEKAAAGTAE